MIIRPSALSRTHFVLYFVSLLASNLLQAIGGILNVKWVIDLAVEENATCSMQGLIKQIGNVGTAVWCVRRGVSDIYNKLISLLGLLLSLYACSG